MRTNKVSQNRENGQRIQMSEMNNSDGIKNVDDVLNMIKPFGWYQILVTFIYIYGYCPLQINSLFMGFGGLKPKWICNDSISNVSKPTSDCSVYEKCPSGNVTFISDFYSVASEWSLVCDQSYFLSLVISIQMAGMLMGALVVGPISDLFGRKWTFFVVLCLEFSIGALSGLAPNPTVFAVFRFLIGACNGAEMIIGWVFAAEATVNRYRLLVRVLGVLSVPLWNHVLLAYLTQHWRWYSIIGNLEGFPILIVLAFFTYESPRWLAQKGRVQEASRILSSIAKFNRASHLLPQRIELETECKHGGIMKKYYVWDLFRTKKLAIYTIVSLVNWFAISLAYYGMYFNLGNMGTSVYVNGAIIAGLSMSVIPIAIYDTYNANANRKFMLIAFFAITTACNVAICFLLLFAPESNTKNVLLTVASSIGQVTTEGSFDVSYVYAVELFPTLLRGNANALMGVGARISAITAPQLLYAGKFWTPLPYVCFGIFSAIGVIITIMFLPNTKKMHLPETYQEASTNDR